MMSNFELAKRLARAIFDAPQGVGNDRTQRIEFKGGGWPNNETNLGGFNEQALDDYLRGVLDSMGAAVTETGGLRNEKVLRQ